MSRILVTGATGFIGSNLVRKLLSNGEEVNIFTRDSSNFWRIKDVLKQCKNFQVDLSNLNKLRNSVNEIQPELVFHCATYGVNANQQNPVLMANSNILNSINLLESLSEISNCRIINLGTSLEYGVKKGVIHEDDSEKPNTLYGISKLAQTNHFSYYALKKNMDITTLRVFSTFGMYEDIGHIVSDIMIALIKKYPIKIRTWNTKRDFIFIEDVVNALVKASKTNQMPRILNVGSGKSYSIKELVSIVKEMGEIKIAEEKLEDGFERIFDTGVADLENTKNILEWTPKHTLQEGLKKTYDWFKQNHNLYETC